MVGRHNLARLLLRRQGILHSCRNISVSQRLQHDQVGPDRVLPASDFRAWEAEAAVHLRLAQSGPASSQPISVPSLLRRQVEQLPDKAALRARGRTGEDIQWTFTQYHEEVRAVGKGLIELGLDPFHTVAILGHNDPAWHISNLAAIHAGGFSTGIYQTNTAAACQYIADDSRANVVVVGDLVQLEKVLSIRDSLPHLRSIVLYGEDKVPSDVKGVVSWKELLDLGRATLDTNLDKRLANIAINQCCILAYTSGTTGNPKGTMLSHDAVTYTAVQNTDLFCWDYGVESVLSYLPLSHVAGQMMDVFLIMSKGGTCCFADKNALRGTLLENIKHFRPSRFVGVPRVFEKIEEGMKAAGAKSGIKKKLADWAKSEALAHHAAEEGGKPHTSLGYRLAHKLILSKVHDALGMDQGQKNGYAIGGAAVSPETVRYFLSLDMKLLEMTAMTETTGMVQITNTVEPGNFRIGRVGKAHNDYYEVALKDRDSTGTGELLSRGRGTCMGYLNNREKTMEALDDDGWLHTGDLVREDDEGFFTVVGRIKEIIITAGGENVAPTNIEEEIKSELPEVVSNVMVVGDKRKYLTCLITLKVTVDPATLAPTDQLDPRAMAWIENIIGAKPKATVKELLSSPDWVLVESAIQAGVERANSRAVSNVANIKKWTVLPREFSVDGGELGPSLKLKRFHVVDMYKDTIHSMYGAEE